MKLNRTKLLRLAASGASGMALAQSLYAATTLEWEYTHSNDFATDQTYGDNVMDFDDGFFGISADPGVDGIVGTPDITLAYTERGGDPNGHFDDYPGWDGRGDVLQADFSTSPISINFTPAPGAGVLISSFILDEWGGGGDSVIDWAVKNGSATIVSGTFDDFSDANDASDAGGRGTVTTGMTLAQALANGGSTLSLELTLVSGTVSYQALDNLVFDQVSVPVVTTIDHDDTADEVSLTWTSITGLTYSIEESSDLGDTDAWEVIPGLDAIAGGDSTTVQTFSSAGHGAKHFYRVVRNP